METLGDAFPKQQARLRRILTTYQAIGPAGACGAAMIEQLLQQADNAAIEGDLVAMIRLYPQMCEVKE